MMILLDYPLIVLLVAAILIFFLRYGDSVRYSKKPQTDPTVVADYKYISSARLYAKQKGWESKFEKLLKRVLKESEGDVRVGHIQWIFLSIESNDLNPKTIPVF